MTMEQKSAAVNTRRRYDSSGRRERAQQTRDQITDIARELFLSDGYTDTTVAAIAAAAHVSVETIYKGFGGKPGLVGAIIDKGLAGEGPVPAEQRSDHVRDTEPDPRRILAAWGSFTAELAPRVVPIFLLARDAAAGDPEVAATLKQISAARLERMTVNARGLASAGHPRPGITPSRPPTSCGPTVARTLRTPRHPPRMASRALRPVHRTGPDRRPAPRPRYLKPFRRLCRAPPHPPHRLFALDACHKQNRAKPAALITRPDCPVMRDNGGTKPAPARRAGGSGAAGSDSVTFRDRCGRLRAVRFD